MTKKIIIYGSSRAEGKTKNLAKTAFPDAEFIDVSNMDITYYDYDAKNKDDDFIGVAQKMIEAEVIVFATPVYWYAMSAQLKTFFDRLTDLITIRKEMGRQLKGKRVYMVCTGYDEKMPEGFEVPFSGTANYLDMEYKGGLYGCVKYEMPDVTGFGE